MKKYRFYLIILIGQILVWSNVTDTWSSILSFALWWIGILISFIGVLLQITVSYKD